jgi:hypothetical protein
MFTPDERASLRSELIRGATGDVRISGVAITGSAAAGSEDRWSDIDLAFGVRDGDSLEGVLSDWTAKMHDRHGALHHVDVVFSPWLYRVFILANTLQVDLAFVPQAEFRALTPSFQLVSGESQAARYAPRPQADGLVGMGWLYALHARSCIARGKLWQAEYMVSGLRDSALALACLRHGLSADHGRGFDSLPVEVTVEFEAAIVRQLDTTEILRAFGVCIRAFVSEMRMVDERLAARLEGPLVALSLL